MNKTGQLLITASLNAIGMDSFLQYRHNETYLWKKEKEEEKIKKDTGFVLHVLHSWKGLFFTIFFPILKLAIHVTLTHNEKVFSFSSIDAEANTVNL